MVLQRCLDMKVKTLGMIVGGLLMIIFFSIYYVTSTASKVTPRQKANQQRAAGNTGPIKVMDQDGEVGDTGTRGRKLHPGEPAIPIVQDQVMAQEVPSFNEILKELPAEATVFSVEKMPDDPRLWPGVGNGHVASIVYSDSIYMNGLYNGFRSSSHRARIPSPCAIEITGVVPPAEFKRTYTLNVSTGIFTEKLEGPNFRVVHNIFAHRRVKELLVSELMVSRFDISKPFGITIKVNHGPDSEDIKLEKGQSLIAGARYMHGSINTPEFNDSVKPEVHIYHSTVPDDITLPESMLESTWLYLTSISHTRKLAEDKYAYGLKLFQMKSLTHTHVTDWANLWGKGRIDVEGNQTIAQLNYASLYYLLSCLPLQQDTDWPFVGLSPEGLDHGSADEDYWGHVMWDQETWQYPPILMLYPDMAELLLETRTRTLTAAKRQAKLRGYQGAMYPWESAYTGRDVTVCKNCTLYEQHISGDIALAVQQYLLMTNNLHFLKNKDGAELVTAIAEFWKSRVTWNDKTNSYNVLGVMPPDEYHYPVDNSVYTNSVAAISLLLPSYALPLIGQTPPRDLREIADQLYVPFDLARRYHPEYDGYKPGIKVKQADAILLGFPLMRETDLEIRKNDLTIYQEFTDKDGPSMTWQMFCIGWLELKDFTKAKQYFEKSILNAKGPFKVWTENVNGSGAVNFRTGMGAYLQSMIFGYGGFRIKEEGLTFDPTLPPSSTSFKITGLDYLGNALNFVFDQKSTTVRATSTGEPLILAVPGMSKTYPLTLNQPVTISRHKAVIRRNK